MVGSMKIIIDGLSYLHVLCGLLTAVVKGGRRRRYTHTQYSYRYSTDANEMPLETPSTCCCTDQLVDCVTLQTNSRLSTQTKRGR